MNANYLWYGVGFIGQGFFFSRFLLQWIASEREGRSVIPMSFWYLSLLGGVTLLVYAIHLRDPVFIMGQSIGAVVYLRNLHFRMRDDAATT